ncbi:MAG: FAD/NAD(P)-binding protein [Desulfuromonadales bacterium]|jgi:sulfhydrogenase subunit gamma (sulfur reductase)
MLDDLRPINAELETIVPMVTDNHLFTFLPEQPIAVAPGQFVEISLPGVGSFPVSISRPVRNGRIESCIRRTGRVTDALYRLKPGTSVGLRGAFGNGFDLKLFAGRDVLMIAGGLGMAPLRALLLALLAESGHEGRIILLYGSREPRTLLFREELLELARTAQIELRFSVDFAADLQQPFGQVVCRIGLVSDLLEGLQLVPERVVAVICGPPALYGCVLEELAARGLPEEQILVTLERRMRCGIGECCHCVAGGRYVCRDGPVFSLAELRTMPGAL